MATTSKLERLRSLMTENSLHAYIVPSGDAHQSEYVADFELRREFISGFTGSAGTAVITNQEALLWTDGRYFLQAETELDKNWKLMKDRLPTTVTIEDYLSKNLSKESRVGIDPTVVAKATAKRYVNSLEKNKHTLVYLEQNLIDKIWDNRPSAPSSPVLVHPIKYSGQSTADKIEKIRAVLEAEGVDALVVSALDEVAWVLNVRGTDIQYNPVVISYVIIAKEYVQFFVLPSKVTEEAKAHLEGVSILPYESFFAELKRLNAQKKRVWVNPKSSIAIFNEISDDLIYEKESPITMAKAIKNDVEINGMKQCHLRDAAALIQFFSWLEEELEKEHTITSITSISTSSTPTSSTSTTSTSTSTTSTATSTSTSTTTTSPVLTEVSVSDKLEEFRSQQEDFFSLSFATIAGSGPNGAIIHYHPQKETCATLSKSQMFLCDSGGQYRDGTTDVTRTLHFGTPTPHEKECYTRVLMGHIALGSAVFPKGTATGKELDTLARMPLWRAGLDYAHGTGHGVGSFLNVHEGPQGISNHTLANMPAFAAGMTITNEPGYYEQGNFGIRIENVMIVANETTKYNDGKFLHLKPLTMVPYDTKLMDVSLLSDTDVDYVNEYHRQCLAKVGPLLQHNENALHWLKHATQPISKHIVQE